MSDDVKIAIPPKLLESINTVFENRPVEVTGDSGSSDAMRRMAYFYKKYGAGGVGVWHMNEKFLGTSVDDILKAYASMMAFDIFTIATQSRVKDVPKAVGFVLSMIMQGAIVLHEGETQAGGYEFDADTGNFREVTVEGLKKEGKVK